MLELLEGRARRQPHGEPTGGHRRQRVRRAQPRVRRHLVALERGLRAGWQDRGEEPGIEPARHRRRRHPARQRDEPVGPQPQVELVGDLDQGRLAAHERRARRPDPRLAIPARTRRRRPAARPPPRTARGSRRRGRRGPAPARGRRRAPRRPRPARWPTARRARPRHRPDRPGRPGRRGRPARTPSSRAGGSAAPRARPRPSRSRTTVAAGRGSTGPIRHAASAIGDRGGELVPERGGIGHRQAAGEAAADIGARPAVDRRVGRGAAAPRSAHRPRASATTWFGRYPRRTSARSARVAGAVGRRPRSRSRGRAPAPGPSRRATGRTRSGTGRRTGRPCASPAPRRSGSAPSPVHAASRSRTRAAIALPDGTALSWTSLGRVTSRSWSSAVSKKPPAGSREARQDAIHQGAGGREPALVEGRLVQRQQAVGEMRVVLEDAGADRPAVLPRPAERPVRPEQPIHDRGRRASGRARVRRGRRRDRRPTGRSRRRRRRRWPGRSRPPAPCRRGPAAAASRAAPGAGSGRGPAAPGRRPRSGPSRSASCVVGDDPRQDRDPLPVALVGHPVRRLEQAGLVAEDVADLGRPPGEGQALDPVGVGVLAGGERAVRRS